MQCYYLRVSYLLNYFPGGRNTKDLAKLRKIKTSKMAITSKRRIHPKKIPPTADAASLFSYRVYLQVVYWKTLMRTDINATSWGWPVKDEKLEPIMMTNVSQTNIFDILNKFPCRLIFQFTFTLVLFRKVLHGLHSSHLPNTSYF